MYNKITLDEIQGEYTISYQTTPQIPDVVEKGDGDAKITGNKLVGIDGHGVNWNGNFEILEDGTIAYEALLDPKTGPPDTVILDESGIPTRDEQFYKGTIKVTKSNGHVILRTKVPRGMFTIDVQFKKK